jgi:hypothetical protein
MQVNALEGIAGTEGPAVRELPVGADLKAMGLSVREIPIGDRNYEMGRLGRRLEKSRGGFGRLL